MLIRVIKPLRDVYAELQPEVGGIYKARPGKPRSGTGFCILEIGGKFVTVRAGEYEVIRRDPEDDEKQPPLWREKEDTKMNEQGMHSNEVELREDEALKTETVKEKKKPGPKPKSEAKQPPEAARILKDIAELKQQHDALHRELQNVIEALQKETTARKAAERALCRMAIERYGKE